MAPVINKKRSGPGRSVIIMITPELLEWAKDAARSEGKTFSLFVEELLAKERARKEQKK